MKKGLQISFSWLFAIIVGGVILFLAFFASSKIITQGQYTVDTTTAKQLGILTNPLEMGFESAEKNTISLPSNTRMFNSCENQGTFGKQQISFSQKSFGKWSEPGSKVSFENKYFFSNSNISSKMLILFSKPFEFPFKVTDLVIIIPLEESYCFVDSPSEVKGDVSNLGLENVEFENCSKGSQRVCFSKGSGCEQIVDYKTNSILKGQERIYFSGDGLMYAGIFSEKEIYECQVQRLMKRVEALSKIYQDKESLLVGKCNSNLGSSLELLKSQAEGLKSSQDLLSIEKTANSIRDLNGGAICRLW